MWTVTGAFLYKISVKCERSGGKRIVSLYFFYTSQKKFIAHLYGFCLINVIVDQIRINDIFKIGIGILQFCGCLFQIIEKYCMPVLTSITMALLDCVFTPSGQYSSARTDNGNMSKTVHTERKNAVTRVYFFIFIRLPNS